MAMIPSSIGPYKILEALGEGGMGVVYRAAHSETGMITALKTVRVAQSGRIAGIRREIRALASLRHPGIVRIFDHGVHEGFPWYAMEFIQARSLRDALFQPELMGIAEEMSPPPPAEEMGRTAPYGHTEELKASRASEQTTTEHNATPQRPTVRPTRSLVDHRADVSESMEETVEGSYDEWLPPQLTMSETLGLLHQLCSALAYLHGEGLVHRDLKPENVLVRPSGHLVLVDFGLAHDARGGIGRETMSSGMIPGGTAYYMAPEQIEGQWVDARSDLYALGCIIYEALCGDPPFRGGSSAEVMTKHIRELPAPLSERVANLPAEIDQLVSDLLAKEPRQRPGYAEDVAAVFERFCTPLLDPATLPEPRPFLYRPALAGRERALHTVRTLLDNLHARQGALCLIGGESGIGKTRLALECVQQAMRDRKADVYIGACAPIGSRRTGGALHPMRTVLEAISDRLREDGERQTLDILGKDVRLLSQFEPSLATLPTVSEMDEPVSLPAREAEMRVYVALQRVFERLSRLRPILLVLDDLQWADDLTMGWLRFLVRSRFDQRCRLLILGIFRREEKTIELDRLMQMERVDNLFLERLDRQAVGEVVRTMLAMPRAPDEFVDFLHRESEGNPFFVAEYLRTAVTEGMLTRDRSGKWRLVQAALDDLALESLELPRALKQLIERRIDALDVEARRAAEFAAVLGRQFSPDLLAEGLSATDLSGVDQLVERDVLDFDDDGRLFFAHEKIREVTYAQIPAPRRAELHRLAAECLTRRDMRGQYLAQRAHHWEFAGEVGLARSCYYDSAASATSRFEFGEAKQLFHAYLNLVSQADGESIGCRQQLGRLLLESGETHAAEVQATIAFDEASALDLTVEQGRSYVLLAEINRVRGDVDSALWQLQMASEAFADPSCEVEECHRLMLLARIRADLSESDAAEQANTAALILSRRHEMRKDEGQILNNLATIHFLRGEFDSGRSEITEALEIHRAEGDRLAEGLALGILGTSYQEQGHFDRAIALREEALRIHRELGQRGMEGHALAALGHLYLEQGDSERALLFFAQALDIHREVGNRRYEGTTITGLATLLMENGEFEQSEKRYEEALALHHEVGHKSFQAATLINLGCLRRRLGWLDECDEALMSASIILDEIDDPYGSALHQCQLGHLRLARGDSAQEQHERASEIATRLHTTPQSELGRAVDALGEALSASEKGEVLYRGESLRHLAPAVQHGLATRGLLTTR